MIEQRSAKHVMQVGRESGGMYMYVCMNVCMGGCKMGIDDDIWHWSLLEVAAVIIRMIM